MNRETNQTGVKRKKSKKSHYLRSILKKLSQSILPLIFSTVSLLLLIALATFTILTYLKWNKRINALYDDLNKLTSEINQTYESIYNLFLRESSSKSRISLTSTGYQEIGDGFYIENISIEPHMNGVRVKGKVVNYHMVSYSQIQFRLTIGESSNTFHVDRIRPSSSAWFEVYVPDVNTQDTYYGYMECINRWMGHY